MEGRTGHLYWAAKVSCLVQYPQRYKPFARGSGGNNPPADLCWKKTEKSRSYRCQAHLILLLFEHEKVQHECGAKKARLSARVDAFWKLDAKCVGVSQGFCAKPTPFFHDVAHLVTFQVPNWKWYLARAAATLSFNLVEAVDAHAAHALCHVDLVFELILTIENMELRYALAADKRLGRFPVNSGLGVVCNRDLGDETAGLKAVEWKVHTENHWTFFVGFADSDLQRSVLWKEKPGTTARLLQRMHSDSILIFFGRDPKFGSIFAAHCFPQAALPSLFDQQGWTRK